MIDMIEALKLIAARSPAAAGEAMKAIRAVGVESPAMQARYNHVVELAFSDSDAEFSAAERALIAAHVEPASGDNLTEIVRFRVSPAEKEAVREMARQAGQKVSDFLRSRVFRPKA